MPSLSDMIVNLTIVDEEDKKGEEGNSEESEESEEGNLEEGEEGEEEGAYLSPQLGALHLRGGYNTSPSPTFSAESEDYTEGAYLGPQPSNTRDPSPGSPPPSPSPQPPNAPQPIPGGPRLGGVRVVSNGVHASAGRRNGRRAAQQQQVRAARHQVEQHWEGEGALTPPDDI